MWLRPISPTRALTIQVSDNSNIGLNTAPKRKPQGGKSATMKKLLPNNRPRSPQVAFPKPFPQSPNVAIIGGGLSGLVCALQLAERGIKSTVFDTGEHSVGGRVATRSAIGSSLRNPEPRTLDPRLVFDHAAQYFTASDPRFVQMVESWRAKGAVGEWKSGSVGLLNLSPSSNNNKTPPTYTPIQQNRKMYIGKGGMRQLAEFLASTAENSRLVEVRRPMWVNSIRFLNFSSSGGGFGWKVSARGVDQGVYDAVVIAHNGKCANKLSAPMGVPAVHAALRKLKLSANWVLMVAFEGAKGIPVPVSIEGKKMEGAFIKNSEILGWAGNNTAKLKFNGVSLHSSSPPLECWTLISTQKYGKLHKVPQEAVPQDVVTKITKEMLTEFAQTLGMSSVKDLPPVVYSKAQLWGAALPLNTPNVGCIWDTAGRVGVAGDWVNGGGSIESAALSGVAMAECIANEAKGAKGKNLGLDGVFQKVKGEEIGVFP
jgi:predicted NAD/FAD-dependent oxidoreductase